MAVFIEPAYTLPDENFARIAHSGNWFQNVIATPNSTATGYSANGPMGLTSFETWRPYDNLFAEPTDWSDAAWNKARVTVDGFKVIEDSTASNTHYLGDAITFGTGAHVLTVDVKAAERSEIRLVFFSGVEDPSEVGTRYFNIADGTVGAGDDTTGTITHLGGGVYRCTIVFTPTTGAGVIHIRLADGSSDTYTGDGTSGLFVYRAFLSLANSNYKIGARAAKQADYCCIGAHNLGTAGATVILQYLDGTFQSIMTVTPTDDSPIWLMFEPETRQEWRLLINSAVEPTMGNIKIGKALKFDRTMRGGYAPIQWQRETEFRTNWSSGGELLARRAQARYLKASFEWPLVSKSWVDTNWADLTDALEQNPFFIAPNPKRTKEAAFCVAEGINHPSYVGVTDLMQIGMQVKAYA